MKALREEAVQEIREYPRTSLYVVGVSTVLLLMTVIGL